MRSHSHFSLRHVALLLGAAGWLLLTGCVGDMPHRGAWVSARHNPQVQQANRLTTAPHFATAPTPAYALPTGPAVVQSGLKRQQ